MDKDLEIPLKLSEIQVSLDSIKEKLPLLERTVNELYKDANNEKLEIEKVIHRVDILEKEMANFTAKREKCIGTLNCITDLQFNLKSLSKDLDLLTKEVDDVKTKTKSNPLTMERLIQLAPALIAIISFVGFIIMELFANKFSLKLK